MQDVKSLKIKALSLQSFRNYHSLQLENIGDISIFIGQNAIGKTSILEAIQLLTELKSFRTHKIDQLIQWNKAEAFISLDITDGVRELHEKLYLQNGKKHYNLNGKKKTIQDLKGLLPAVVFTPDDLYLIKGSHSLRRDAFDNLGVQLSKNFYSVRNDYLKLIKQKNIALKDEVVHDYIESLNDVVIKVGTQYILHRFTLLSVFIPFFQEAFRNITNQKEEISVQYIFSWGEKVKNFYNITKDDIIFSFEHALKENFKEEVASQRSKIGPHADKIDFFIKNDGSANSFQPAREFASQGQQRSIVLAFKIAELKTIQHIIHQQPVLLLDDVMSELDSTRRSLFIQLIEGEIQTFITTTSLAYFENDTIKKADIYQLPL